MYQISSDFLPITFTKIDMSFDFRLSVVKKMLHELTDMMFRDMEFITAFIWLAFLQIILHLHSCLYYLLYFINCFHFHSH